MKEIQQGNFLESEQLGGHDHLCRRQDISALCLPSRAGCYLVISIFIFLVFKKLNKKLK